MCKYLGYTGLILILFISVLYATFPVTICQLGMNSTSGIVALWHFNEDAWVQDQADDVKDVSGNGHHGTPKDAAAITATAKFGNAGDFDGTANCGVLIDNHADFALGAGASFSLSVWIRSTSIASRQYIFDKYNGGAGKRQYILQLNVSKIVFSVGNSDGSDAISLTGATTLTAYENRWIWIVAVFDNDADLVYIYLNGVSDQTPAAKADDCFTSDLDLYIAASQEVSTRNVFGQLDEPAYYNKALSAEEINHLYHRNPKSQ
jgi:hypothetical protein